MIQLLLSNLPEAAITAKRFFRSEKWVS